MGQSHSAYLQLQESLLLGELEGKVPKDRNVNTTLTELLYKEQSTGLCTSLMTFTEPPQTPCDVGTLLLSILQMKS